MPLAYEGQFPGGLAHIQALVQHGALTLTSEGTTVEALIEQGIEALTHPGILNFELQWGEYYRVTVSEQGIAFIVDSAPHRWQLRLRPIITRLNSEIIKVLGTPEVKAKLASMGVDIDTSTPEEFGAFIETEMKKWARVIKEGNIRVEMER